VAVLAVSDYLRRELEAKVPEARGKTEVVDSGVDLERFTVAPTPDGPPRFLCVGSLIPRKNVLRLADAFTQLGEGTLTFVGDGPLRPELQGRAGIKLTGPLPNDELPARIADAHVVCQPSLIEPFGQVTLEAMACGRSVVASRVGGAPEFVPPDAGVLVDPVDDAALVAGLRAASALPRPNAAARSAAEAHDVRRQAERVERILERAARARRA
jgi:glycosyltransferase involved in cell wall biosynthesis